MLSKADLFARLAEGHAARVTVVTPNKRLSQALMAEFDAFQIKKDLRVWEAPDILPIGAFVERLWEDALYSDRGEKLPLLLTPAQEQHIWEQILEKSGLLIVAEAAAQCREAWRLMHQWRIGAVGGTEDVLAFSKWSSLYQKQTAGDIDAARLPDLMKDSAVAKPKLLVAYAFDVVPPQTKEFLEEFEAVFCMPEEVVGDCTKASFAAATQEIEAAAKWARARLEAGAQRIGVVVPELHKHRREVARTFSRVMQPGYCLPGGAKAAMPFNVSLGRPLAAYPLIDLALSLLKFSHQPLEFAEASHLLRSPFLGGADGELARRAALDARLRRNAGPRLALAKLIAESDSCPDLRRRLEKVFELAKSKPGSPAECARHFSALLEAAGFPGERAADSEEFQTRAKWHEALGELARLERIVQKFSFEEGIAFLQRYCADTLFQAAHFPHGPDAPIQVLGLIEAQGLRFDCLWVSGLTDEAWPRDARPNPFLAAAAQRKAGVPQASAEASLALDRRITEDWQRAAREVVLSWPRKDNDRDLAPSPLITSVEEKVPAIPELPRYRDLLFGSRKLESFEDRKGPAFPPGKVRGGTRVLADQAACAFRAFAKWRLSADELEEAVDGLDARGRGKLMHLLMKELWSRLKSSKALEGKIEAPIAQSAEAAVKEMGLDGRFAELERERLAKLAREWLELERRREPFKVLSLEEKRDLKVGDLEFQSRIDRMDALEGGGGNAGHVLIDYKSARFLSVRDWEGPRTDDPQLPLYAVAAPEALAAVAFAKVRPGDMRFVGFSKDPNAIPGVKPAESWPGLLAQWKKDAEALSKAFAAGNAEVDPKEALKTCRLCAMQTLCRVYEKLNVLKDEE